MQQALAAVDARQQDDADVVRLLTHAALMVPLGAKMALERLATGGKNNDLLQLAKDISEQAAQVTTPGIAYRAALSILLDPALPVMSDDAYVGCATLAVAEIQVNAEKEARQRRAEELRQRYRAVRASNRLRDTPTWRAAVRDRSLCYPLQPALDGEDLDDLISAYAEPRDEEEARAALALLRTAIERAYPPMNARQTERLSRALMSRARNREENPRLGHDDLKVLADIDGPAVVGEFIGEFEKRFRVDLFLWEALCMAPRNGEANKRLLSKAMPRLVRLELETAGTVWSYEYWIRIAQPEASRFLMRELDPLTLPPTAANGLIYALLSMATKPAITRLRQIRAMGGETEEYARVAVEILGAESQHRIDAMAADWRQKRSREALERFYRTYVQHVPLRVSFVKWRERLGPNDLTQRSFWVRPIDGEGGLYIDMKRNGRLQGIKFEP